MHVFIIPFWVIVALAILAWIGVAYVYWFKPKMMPKIDEYFAQRRHERRERNRLRNYANGRTLYDVNTIRKPEVYYAPARHRR